MILRGLELLASAIRFIIGALMISLAIPVGMQVVARYTGIIPVYLWTEELATFIFVWVVMLGSTLAVWEGTHFDVQVIADAKSPLLLFLQKALVLTLIALFAILFAWYGIDYAEFGGKQNSVMMRANLMITHISVPIAGTLWAVFALYRLFEAFAVYRTNGQAMS
jgi:TRAP-type C4-dicarboxylate transport system permease small subunit|tara:strand:- start:28067 stop:28561 length:495 start_codon:yes stop_codon:yes gene_type:complete